MRWRKQGQKQDEFEGDDNNPALGCFWVSSEVYERKRRVGMTLKFLAQQD